MKTARVLAMAAVLSAGISAPALADYVRLGSVEVGYRTDRDTSWTRFGGGMEGLRLTADRSDILCRAIVVQFGDGSRQTVFSGPLRQDRPVEVDLRGGTRRVRNISFTCRSDARRGGVISIAANVGRFQDEWRRSPDWALFWSRLFNWGAVGGNTGFGNGYDPNVWVSLGRERFEGRRDRESSFAGWNGRSVDRIGLRAVDDDARCSAVRAIFGNGRSSVLNVARLDRGRFASVDLPGGDRNLRSLSLACHAVNRNAVTIEIFARK